MVTLGYLVTRYRRKSKLRSSRTQIRKRRKSEIRNISLQSFGIWRGNPRSAKANCYACIGNSHSGKRLWIDSSVAQHITRMDLVFILSGFLRLVVFHGSLSNGKCLLLISIPQICFQIHGGEDALKALGSTPVLLSMSPFGTPSSCILGLQRQRGCPSQQID